MASSQFPANGVQFPTTFTTPANALVNRASNVDTTNSEGIKSSNSTFSANKRKREPVGGSDINDIGEKKSVGDDNNVESEAGMKEVEMKDAEATEINGSIKEVEMQDAIEVKENITSKGNDERQVIKEDHTRSNPNATESYMRNQSTDVSKCNDAAKVNKDDYMRLKMNATEDRMQNQTTKLGKSECNENQIGNSVTHDDERKVNKDDYARFDMNASTEVCKQNQSTNKLERNEKQIGGVIRGDEGKVNKEDNMRSNMSASKEVCKQNQSTDKCECNEKQIRVGASGQRALGEVATLLKQVEGNSDDKADVEVEVKVVKKTGNSGDSKGNGDGNQTITR